MIDRCAESGLRDVAERLTVVLTRPAGQALELAQALATQGLGTFEFPLMQLQALEPSADLQTAFASLERYALVVFVSPNAIEYAFKHVNKTWPVTVPIGVLGPGSTRALARQGIAAPTCQVIAPLATSDDAASPQTARYDSEALVNALEQTLGLASLKGQRVLIVRGNGGRPWLTDCLRSYGVRVETVTAYQRLLPNPTPSQWARVQEILANRWHVWLITSSESVRNLQTLAQAHLDAPQQLLLKRAQLIVTHARIAETARALGFDTITETAGEDASIIHTLLSSPGAIVDRS